MYWDLSYGPEYSLGESFCVHLKRICICYCRVPSVSVRSGWLTVFRFPILFVCFVFVYLFYQLLREECWCLPSIFVNLSISPFSPQILLLNCVLNIVWVWLKHFCGMDVALVVTGLPPFQMCQSGLSQPRAWPHRYLLGESLKLKGLDP